MRDTAKHVLAWLLVGSTLAASALARQAQPDVTFFAVSYVETQASATKAAIEALGRYRGSSRAQDGFSRIEFFEQIGRPGHFAVVEVWRDQPAFDARDATPQKQLQTALQSIRVSGYDQRPYKPLTTGATTNASGEAVFVIAHVDVTPNPQVPELLRGLADASRKEAGNLRFDVYQHTMRGNHFTVVEGWRNQQALDAHVTAAHTKQYRDTLQPMTGSPLDERIYKLVQ